MKLTVFSSLLCLALGFFLGHKASPPSPDLSPPPVTQSYREPRNDRQLQKASTSNQITELERIMTSTSGSHGHQLQIRARLQSSLLNLKLEDIPHALEILQQQELETYHNQQPHEISDEMLLFLSRWYELEGESVLAWMNGQQQWNRRDIFNARQLTILDGFHRDPKRSFELILEMKNRIAENEIAHELHDISSSSFEDEIILYQIARWSKTPLQMLHTFDPEGHFLKTYDLSLRPSSRIPRDLTHGNLGFPITPRSPTSFSSNSKIEAFARGLADANRLDLLRRLSTELDGSPQEAIQEVLRNEASKQGWQEVKNQIDQGILDPTKDDFSEILTKLAATNRDQALAWYLALPESENITRADRIARAVLPSGPFESPQNPSDDPFAQGKFDFKAAHQWLTDLQTQGEPIAQAASNLHAEALRHFDWAIIKENRKFLTTSDWQWFEEEIILAAMSRQTETIRGEDITWAGHQEQQIWLTAAAEFNLLDQVKARIQQTNAHSRATLRTLLEKLEAEAAQ